MSSPEPLQQGPCSPWATAQEVADCCGVDLGSDTEAAFEQAAADASLVLYLATGQQFAGLCERTVRPQNPGCGCWRGDYRHGCCCPPLSRVKLGGYPVRQVDEVLIDGAALDPSEYRLDQRRYLTRMADEDGRAQSWPGCQRLDREATEDDTFAVSYVFGQEPPALGATAASALACELLRACPGDSGVGGECKLPAGARRVVRQGVTVEIASSVAALFLAGVSGIAAVDVFVRTYNPQRLMRRSSVWTPDLDRYAQSYGG